ncbi:MAG: non-canonical purine NTP diphosphatase [Flavobacteriaceae bacterium]
MKLVFASHNKHKIQEIKQLLPNNIEIVSLEEIGCKEDIPETADTIEGNATLKADYVTQNYGLPCFADDSGLEVEVLDGAPGVFSARYGGEQKNDNDNIEKLLEVLKNETNRKAQFKTVIALNLNKEKHLFTGIIKGEIITEKKGTKGFGYDPVFVPENSSKTFAEFSAEDKNKVSHRAKAVKKLVEWLTNRSFE